jgi:hypothetical protein
MAAAGGTVNNVCPGGLNLFRQLLRGRHNKAAPCRVVGIQGGLVQHRLGLIVIIKSIWPPPAHPFSEPGRFLGELHT